LPYYFDIKAFSIVLSIISKQPYFKEYGMLSRSPGMKQKYAITKDADTDQIRIQEFAELDKDNFSLVCEETYDRKKVQAAAAEGKEPLIELLRTPNLYPVSEYVDKIADSVNALFEQSDQDFLEVEFDDIEALKKEKQAAESEGEEESVALDDLLEDELEEDQGGEADTEESEESEDKSEKKGPSLSDEDSLDVFDDDEGEENP